MKSFFIAASILTVLCFAFCVVSLRGKIDDTNSRIDAVEHDARSAHSAVEDLITQQRKDHEQLMERYTQLNSEVARIQYAMYMSACLNACKKDALHAAEPKRSVMCLNYCQLTSKDHP
jgi:hypothetical protein